MKQPVTFFRWRPFLVMLFLSLASLVLWGQDESGESSPAITPTYPAQVGGTTWYTSPWVWVFGAAVIVLLLVALFSSGSGKEEVRVPKTGGR